MRLCRTRVRNRLKHHTPSTTQPGKTINNRDCLYKYTQNHAEALYHVCLISENVFGRMRLLVNRCKYCISMVSNCKSMHVYSLCTITACWWLRLVTYNQTRLVK